MPNIQISLSICYRSRGRERSDGTQGSEGSEGERNATPESESLSLSASEGWMTAKSHRLWFRSGLIKSDYSVKCWPQIALDMRFALKSILIYRLHQRSEIIADNECHKWLAAVVAVNSRLTPLAMPTLALMKTGFGQSWVCLPFDSSQVLKFHYSNTQQMHKRWEMENCCSADPAVRHNIAITLRQPRMIFVPVQTGWANICSISSIATLSRRQHNATSMLTRWDNSIVMISWFNITEADNPTPDVWVMVDWNRLETGEVEIQVELRWSRCMQFHIRIV